MRKMKWGKGTNTCRLCQGAGHNIRSCPELPKILEEAKKIAKDPAYLPLGRRNYNYYTWQHAEAIFEEGKRKQLKTRPKSTKPRRCSFCKMTGHTKRNCSDKTETKAILYDANVIWRKSFLKKAKEVGLAPGALLKLRKFQSYSGGVGGWRVYKNTMTLVTGADWDELTFMNSYGLHWQYQALWFITHHLALPDNDVQVRIGQHELKELFGSLFYADPSKTVSVRNIEVVTPAEVLLDDGWVYNHQVKEIEWLIGHHSLEQLENELQILPWAKAIIKNGIRP